MFKKLLLMLSMSLAGSLAANPGTAFTYQGSLNDGGVSVSGPVEMLFVLYDAEENGNVIAGPISRTIVVENGLVATALDFGDVFGGGARFLSVIVDVDGEEGPTAPVELTPRQEVRPVPYAQYATRAGSADTATTAQTAVNVINDQVNDADSDPTNELQTLSLAGTSLAISRGNTVDLGSLVSGGDFDSGDYLITMTVIGGRQGNISFGASTRDSLPIRLTLPKDFENSIILLNGSQAINAQLSLSAGSTPTSQLDPSPFALTKFVDASTPLLYDSLAKAEELDITVRIYLADTIFFSAPSELYRIEFLDCFLTNMSFSTGMTEQISFNAQRVKHTHVLTNRSVVLDLRNR